MSDEAKPDETNAPGSVFGNLPASRPGTRSPRRDQGGKGKSSPAAGAGATSASTAARAKPKPKPAAKPRAAAKPTAQPKQPTEPPAAPRAESGGAPADEAEAQTDSRGGIEDLAWAGIATAAEAATLGVRLVSRAMGAVRDSVDRR